MDKNVCEKNGYLNRLSTEQLEELLRADFESDENSDVDVIFHILEVIEEREKKHPTGRLPNATMAWEEFQQYYNIPDGEDMQLYPYGQAAEDETESPSVEQTAVVSQLSCTHHSLWNILVASVAVIVFLSGMVVAQAAGIDVFGAIGQWTEDTFHFVSSWKQQTSYQNRDSKKGTNPENSQYQTAIQKTLKICGIDESLAPSWYPSDVTISEPQILSNDYSEMVRFSFSDGKDKFFSIDITRNQTIEDLIASTFEKDNAPVEQYTSGTKTFYIFSNEDTITATWSSDILVETIAGNLQIDELKTIIDSIGE